MIGLIYFTGWPHTTVLHLRNKAYKHTFNNLMYILEECVKVFIVITMNTFQKTNQ